MKRITLARLILASVLAGAFVLAGCGGDDGVSPTTHEELQMDHDELVAALAAAQDEVTRLNALLGDEDNPADDSVRGMLAAANANVMSLTGQLETANGEVTRLNGELSTANGNVMSLTGQLETANGNVTRLMGELETANGEVTRLTGELGTANADVMRLTGELETASGMVTTLTGQLETANGMVTTLTGQLETANGEVTRLTGELGTANGMVTTLTGQLETANNNVRRLTTEVDGDGTDENPGLRELLRRANERIKNLVEGKDPEQLGPIVNRGTNASTNAGNNSTMADDYATKAEMESANRATIQTGEANSVEHAENARGHATTASDKAEEAKTAAEKAAEATNTADAEKYASMAEDAAEAAEEAMNMAISEYEEAKKDAELELKIDDSTHSVGDISLDADADNNIVTRGSGADRKTVNTGFQQDLQEEATGMVAGVDFVANTAPTADVAYVQAVEARNIDIGKVVDSADDMARLAVVTQYVGSKTVRVYADNVAAGNENTTKAGRMSVIDGADGNRNTDDDTYVPLRREGTYYPVDNTGGDNNALEATDMVTADAEGKEVLSFLDVGPDGAVGGGDDVRVYVVLETTSTTGDTTTYDYDVIDVLAPAKDDPDGAPAEDAQVTANIPEAADYDHIHFGVWASLDEDGETPSHGIGFVQNFSGEGMTAVADMQRRGTATFNGNWVATVQEQDPNGDGAITIGDGVAVLTADFDDAEVTVNLMGLAMLEGDISGNTFSGDEATVGTNSHNLAAGADFEGEFMGGFFGDRTDEAGGVFDFGSDGNEDGAFVGAFGGARD